MIRLQGIAVSPGVAIGKASVFNSEGHQITVSHCSSEKAAGEVSRLRDAVQAAMQDISESRDSVAQSMGKQYGAIFEGHLVMLQDQKLYETMENAVMKDHFTAEYAVYKTLHGYAQVFQSIQDAFMAERANDILDLEKRILRILLKEKRQLQQFTEPVVVFARNLTPSETASMDTKFVQAFATELGGPTSHTAIVAEALRIPAVVGVGNFLERVNAGEVVIVDGDAGVVILNPDQATLNRYCLIEMQKKSLDVRLESLRDLPALTIDGTPVQLLGNIEFPQEADSCMESGAEGIGLYRTEFLYLSGSIPDEEDHFHAYRQVIEAMKGKPVTIRTVDLGADKLIERPVSMRNTKKTDLGYYIEEEKNPCLGLRSIRLSLKRIELFRKQLRAILRAGVFGPVKVMFPLVSTISEWRQAHMIVEDVKEDLSERGIPYASDVDLGIMVEVPSVVLMIEHFAKEVDFFSIGTNDLTQYTLAVDRTNKDVFYLYNSCDPVILKLLSMTIHAATQHRRPVSLCGQMSGSPWCTMLLLGLGLRTLSVSPGAIPEIKRVCRRVNLAQCKAVAARALQMEKASEVRNYLLSEYRKLFPDLDVEVS
ncbi:MAG: phosphoenolpyruvate--protein phosphotransferase [Planctomycetia bacterium]|nr:phosphoenolpyruvate--protein phosphotransferase [Planctomycetia bacterium]